MGIAQGDVILAWRQGTGAGSITSPLDFKGIERERGARGTVILTGRRADKPVSWTLKAEYWGITGGSTVPGVQAVIDRLGDFAKANNWDSLERYCRTACMSLEQKPGGRSYALFEAGRLLGDAEKVTKAADFFSKSIDEEPGGRTYFTAQVYEAWAKASFKVNDWASSDRLFRKALRAAEPLAEQSLNAAFYSLSLSESKTRSMELRQAERLAHVALRTANTVVPKSDLTVQILYELGVIAMEADDQPKAEKWLGQALDLGVRVSPKKETLAMIFNMLGASAMTRGDLARAEKYFFQSLEIATRLNTEGPLTSNAWGNLGIVFSMRGNYARAQQCILRALAMQQRQGTASELDVADSLAELASYKAFSGDYVGAATFLQQALKIQERLAPNRGNTLSTLYTYAHVLESEGDYKSASGLLFRALTTLNNINPNGPGVADCHDHLGELYLSERDYKDAQEQYRLAADIDRRLALKDDTDTPMGLAAAAKGLGEDDAALRYYSEAFATLESEAAVLDRSDSVHLFSDYAENLEQFVELLASHGETARAFEQSDHARAQTLVRTLASANVNIVSSVPAIVLEKRRKLESLLGDLSDQRVRTLTQGHSRGLAEIDSKIANAKLELEVAEGQIRTANPHYAALTQPKGSTLRRIQDSLGAGTLLLEYSLGKERGYVFAVDRTSISAFSLPAPSEIERLSKEAFSYWSRQKASAQTDRIGQALSNMVLGPVAALLGGKRTLLIVANGSLQYVPFAALTMPLASGHVGQKLATLYETVNLPSASLIVTMREHSTHRGKTQDAIAIIGDPVFSKDDTRVLGGESSPSEPIFTVARGTQKSPIQTADDEVESLINDETAVRGLQLARLIHSREEAEAIASVSKKDKIVMALDFDATRFAATDPGISNSRIVHFATHGFFDTKNPAMSGLVFSLVDKQGKPQPGFLGLDDIYRSHYSADLVVLSACETALGEEVAGEGLVGLTWGFIYAGAKSVVASLWQVNDASTAELMRMFYAGMEQKGLSASAALRQAQLAISQNPAWSNPYYWAGFVLEGEYDSAR